MGKYPEEIQPGKDLFTSFIVLVNKVLNDVLFGYHKSLKHSASQHLFRTTVVYYLCVLANTAKYITGALRKFVSDDYEIVNI